LHVFRIKAVGVPIALRLPFLRAKAGRGLGSRITPVPQAFRRELGAFQVADLREDQRFGLVTRILARLPVLIEPIEIFLDASADGVGANIRREPDWD